MPARLCVIAIAAFLMSACADKTPEAEPYDPARDYFTFANTGDFITEHLALDLRVDFEAEQLAGNVVHTIRRVDPAATEIVFDTRDLTVTGVQVLLADGEAVAAQHRSGESDANLGTPLVISLPSAASSAQQFRLKLDYATSPASTALQWLPANLTAGGKHPLMFSQSQAIHARSWIPLQDTPAVRATYEATIRTSPQLLAVMSANNDPLTPRSGEYHFAMPQPIPSYLMAIAVGNIFFAPLGEETGVYAEPELLEASVYEFADTQEMLEQAEALFGPYEWGRYDLLVLPPSFPYGGMENPRLSFITPSLLAGDRSLVSVVAHELAHSWSGNLVTNATWRDGWLNEGMTSYLESRLMEVIYDKDRVDEARVLSYEELLLDLQRVPLEMQALAPRLDGGDADSFQGTIHYTKGELFLQYLENEFGRKAFDAYLSSYFDEFAFLTITTDGFLDHLDKNLLQSESSKVSRADVEEWLFEPGLPANAPLPSSATLDAAEAMARAWMDDKVDVDEIPTGNWSAQATVHFINSLPEGITNERLAALDDGLGLSKTKNAEIGRSWFIQVAKRRYTDAYEPMQQYLNRYGRGRLIFPIYMALANNGSDLELAQQIFAGARTAYHPLTENGIAHALQLDGE